MVRLSPVAVTAVLFASASAFVPSSLPISRSAQDVVSTPTSTTLYNVPPPSTEDPTSLKESSDRERPPASFFELQINSARAAQLAIDAGERFIEVEFPPLPAQVLEMDDVSAYDVAKANIELAIDFAKSFAANQKKVTIMLPDEAEAKIAVENLGTDTPAPNVRVSSLRKSDEDDERVFKPDQLFLNLFGTGSGGAVKAVEGTDMYIIIVASAQELPDVEELSELDPGKPIVFYNLKLDVLRGDLGAPAFPGKVKKPEVVEKYHLERLLVFLYTHHIYVCFCVFITTGLSRSVLIQGQACLLSENSAIFSLDVSSSIHGQLSGMSVPFVSRPVPNAARYWKWQVPPREGKYRPTGAGRVQGGADR